MVEVDSLVVAVAADYKMALVTVKTVVLWPVAKRIVIVRIAVARIQVDQVVVQIVVVVCLRNYSWESLLEVVPEDYLIPVQMHFHSYNKKWKWRWEWR